MLAVSHLRLPPGDWSALPLTRLLLDTVEGDDRDRIAFGPVHEITRQALTLTWAELRVVDPEEHRECRSRMCLARGNGVQCLITFAFWPEDEGALRPGVGWRVRLTQARGAGGGSRGGNTDRVTAVAPADIPVRGLLKRAAA